MQKPLSPKNGIPSYLYRSRRFFSLTFDHLGVKEARHSETFSPKNRIPSYLHRSRRFFSLTLDHLGVKEPRHS